MFFGSDNQTGASKQVLDKIIEANEGYTHGYGDDFWTGKAVDMLKEVFECDLEVYFVATGTASNSLALSAMVKPWESVLTHPLSHVINDESTAPEFFTGGSRLVPLEGVNGKITVENLSSFLLNEENLIPHNSMVKALTITQSSEIGLVYSPDELKEICYTAKKHQLYVHMDGARFANALVSANASPAEITWKAGVDILGLGATKCGALCAEAVIFFNKELAMDFNYRRKRAGHLVSKGRIFGAQFVGWLENDHWLEMARHANDKASKLAESILKIDNANVVWPVQANELFAVLKRDRIAVLKNAGAEFYEWPQNALPEGLVLKDEEKLIRLVTSFNTDDEDIAKFCTTLDS